MIPMLTSVHRCIELCPDHLEVEKEKLIQELHILRARLQYEDLVTSGKSANSVPQIPNTAPIQTPTGVNDQAGDGIADQVDSEMRKAGDFKILLLEIEYVELRLEFIVKAKVSVTFYSRYCHRNRRQRTEAIGRLESRCRFVFWRSMV